MLYPHLRHHLILAPSTNIGKSIFSTGLCRSSIQKGERTSYLKPIGTGQGEGDDTLHIKEFVKGLTSNKCLFHFDEPVSPHLAVQRTQQQSDASNGSVVPNDDEFIQAVAGFIQASASTISRDDGRDSVVYIESAGGVHSPVLSGTSQIDAFRPLLPPTILIGSHELGGISTTISAYESLILRGYQIEQLLVFKEEYYENYRYFEKWFQEKGIEVGIVDLPPPKVESLGQDKKNMNDYYGKIEGQLSPVVQHLKDRHRERIQELKSFSERSRESFWWPFVQHSSVKKDQDVMVIDSAYQDHFTTLNHHSEDPGEALLEKTFDGSASWWTQALGHANPTLTLAMAQASGRYGHVLFPSATNQPALHLTEKLLNTVGKDWAKRVFFSDDGSTGVEVGLKMALRSYALRHGISSERSKELKILGFKGSYHGDTMGAVDACEKSVFTERIDWYDGKGAWLSGSQVMISEDQVLIRDRESGETISRFDQLAEVYDVEKRIKDQDPLIARYRDEINSFIKHHQSKGIEFGALILEPIVLGAGGMIFLDPLYQRVLIDLVRSDSSLFPQTTVPVEQGAWKGLPVIHDEVFVGLHRIGPMTSSSLLGSSTHPDIAIYAKILSGGLVPLSVTLASSSIFETFLGDGKVDALLHGHSYTAHPIGCNVALTTMKQLEKLDWTSAKLDWKAIPQTGPRDMTETNKPWSLWSREIVSKLSQLSDRVEGVMTLGTVLVIYLKTSSSGYESSASVDLLNKLKRTKIDRGPLGLGYNVHARPLGNVVYFMSSLNSTQASLRSLENGIYRALQN